MSVFDGKAWRTLVELRGLSTDSTCVLEAEPSDSESVRSDLQKLKNDLLTANVDINESVGLFQDTVETICAPLFKKKHF